MADAKPTLFVSVSFAGVVDVRLGAELTEVAGGKDGEKLNVGKDDLLIGSEMLGRTGASATWRQKANIHKCVNRTWIHSPG